MPRHVCFSENSAHVVNGLTIPNAMTANMTLEKTHYQKYSEPTVLLLFHTFDYQLSQTISAETRTVSTQPAFTCSTFAIKTLE